MVLEGESLQRFNFLLEDLQEKFQPRDLAEAALVENMAVARWRQLRIWAIEKAGLDHQMSQPETNPESTELDRPTRAALAFQTLSSQSRVLDTIGRYETRYEQRFNRSLDRLLRLKKERETRNMIFAKRSQF